MWMVAGDGSTVSMPGVGAMEDVVARVRAILQTPRTEWAVIEGERDAPVELYTRYVAPLGAIPAVARFLGEWLVGGYTTMRWSFFGALFVYAAMFAAVYLVAAVINELAPRFGVARNFSQSLKLSVYSYIPAWLAGIFLLVPGLSFLMLLGVYGVYLLWTGLPRLMRVSDENAPVYVAIVAACAIIPTVVLALT
jgi:hypothetical protein